MANENETKQFAPDTRTSIQKRVKNHLEAAMEAVKAAKVAEFAAGGLSMDNEAHTRRFARAVLVETARVLIAAGMPVDAVGAGACGLPQSLFTDLTESGIIKPAVMLAVVPNESEEEDGNENDEPEGVCWN